MSNGCFSVKSSLKSSLAESSGTCRLGVTSPPWLETSTFAALRAGSENILALISIVAVASSGLPNFRQDAGDACDQ